MARDGSSDGPARPSEEPTRQMGTQRPGPPGQESYRPGDAPTQYDDYADLQQSPEQPEPLGFGGPPPTPWFRRRPVLIAWFALIGVMIALVIWGIIQLTSRGPEKTVPSTTSSTTTTTTTSTTSTTGTTSTTPSATTTAPKPAAPPPPPRPAPAPGGPAPEPPHHHHLPELPPVITIPPIPNHPDVPTVITVPPGLR